MPNAITFQERLEQVLVKDPNALSHPDITFLNARQSYLNPEQRKKYARILNTSTPQETDPSEVLQAPQQPQAPAPVQDEPVVPPAPPVVEPVQPFNTQPGQVEAPQQPQGIDTTNQ